MTDPSAVPQGWRVQSLPTGSNGGYSEQWRVEAAHVDGPDCPVCKPRALADLPEPSAVEPGSQDTEALVAERDALRADMDAVRGICAEWQQDDEPFLQVTDGSASAMAKIVRILIPPELESRPPVMD